MTLQTFRDKEHYFEERRRGSVRSRVCIHHRWGILSKEPWGKTSSAVNSLSGVGWPGSFYPSLSLSLIFKRMRWTEHAEGLRLAQMVGLDLGSFPS